MATTWITKKMAGIWPALLMVAFLLILFLHNIYFLENVWVLILCKGSSDSSIMPTFLNDQYIPTTCIDSSIVDYQRCETFLSLFAYVAYYIWQKPYCPSKEFHNLTSTKQSWKKSLSVAGTVTKVWLIFLDTACLTIHSTFGHVRW